MPVEYRVRDDVSPAALDALFADSWESPHSNSWPAVLQRSMTWITAHDGGKLVGFVNVAWDGGAHAFLLDTTVHPSMRRRGIGTELVRVASEAARRSGAEWLHVDYEPDLARFYKRCGFRRTDAGLLRLAD